MLLLKCLLFESLDGKSVTVERAVKPSFGHGGRRRLPGPTGSRGTQIKNRGNARHRSFVTGGRGRRTSLTCRTLR